MRTNDGICVDMRCLSGSFAIGCLSQVDNVVCLDGVSDVTRGKGGESDRRDLPQFIQNVKGHWKANWQYHHLSFEIPDR